MSTTDGKHFISEKEKLKELSGKKKIQYIWDYYKLPIVILLIVLYIIAYSFYGHFTHKDIALYTAFVNVSTSDDLTKELTEDFLKEQNLDVSEDYFYLYENLFLTEDTSSEYHEYTYASQMKILGAIDSEQLDLVFMNKEAFDAFSQNGYLCDLSDLLSSSNPELLENIAPYLETGTGSYPVGINLSHSSIFRDSGFNETVYLGVIENSPRQDATISYIQYLY